MWEENRVSVPSIRHVDWHLGVKRSSACYWNRCSISLDTPADSPYLISEPLLLPKCSPVSIPNAPAPCPKPTPFGLRKERTFISSLVLRLTRIYERNIVCRRDFLRVRTWSSLPTSSCRDLRGDNSMIIRWTNARERNSPHLKHILCHFLPQAATSSAA